MTDIPILFSAPMVRAIRREIERPGTGKTQTRRILTPANTLFDGSAWTKQQKQQAWDWAKAWVDAGPSPAGNPGPYLKLPWLSGDDDVYEGTIHRIYPKVQPSDRLWVRETWAPLDALTHSDPGVQALADRGFYRADESTVEDEISRWRPGIHMPRSASRLTLTATDVRVQQLKEISEADAIAEGCPGRLGPNPDFPDEWDPSPVEEYRDLWNSLNADRGYGWDVNPWVVAVTFDPKLGNIDELRP